MPVIELPQGYVARPPRVESDAAEAAEVINEWSRAIVGAPSTTVDEVQGWWGRPGWDVEREVILVEDPDGRLCCYLDFDPSDKGTELFFDGYVRPGYEGRGLGTSLVRLAEERAHRMATEKNPSELQLTAWAPEPAQPARVLFEGNGFAIVRRYFRMLIDVKGRTFDAKIPQGIDIRSFRIGHDERGMFESHEEAFQDAWNYWPSTFERWVWEVMKERGDFDPKLVLLAWDGDQIAGGSINRPADAEDPDIAYVSDVWVRRPWRNRGLGEALLNRSFNELAARGKRAVSLGVDSASPTGATRLYERVGMHVDRESLVFGKKIV